MGSAAQGVGSISRCLGITKNKTVGQCAAASQGLWYSRHGLIQLRLLLWEKEKSRAYAQSSGFWETAQGSSFCQALLGVLI